MEQGKVKKGDYGCETPLMGWKNDYIPDKSRGVSWESKQLLLITQPPILVNNNRPGLGKNKSFVNHIQSYKNS